MAPEFVLLALYLVVLNMAQYVKLALYLYHIDVYMNLSNTHLLN